MTIGSAFWRAKNYGYKPLFRYFVFDKLRLDSVEKVNYQLLKQLDLENLGFDLLDFCEDFCEKIVKQIQSASESKLIKFSDNFPDSINRLVAIGNALIQYRPDLYIETGTQHGVSASFVEELAIKIGLEIQVVSFDVVENLWTVSGNYQKICFRNQVRKNFTFELQRLSQVASKIIFFHDSDHSFENMFYELNLVSKLPNIGVVISDDIENNSAFYKVLKKKKFQVSICKIDSGPMAGIARRIRN